jgi:hypothetical protein
MVAARQLLDWARRRMTRVWWGSGRRDGSFGGSLRHGGVDYYLFAAYTSGSVEVYFQWLKGRPAFASESSRRELLNRLNEIPGVRLPDDAIHRRPSLQLTMLGNEGRMARFLAVLDWVVERIEQDGE